MNSHIASLREQLPDLLRRLADPITPYTAAELWSRLHAENWDLCLPVLHSQLQAGPAEVQRLVIAILIEQAEQLGKDSLPEWSRDVANLMMSADRLVRMAAIEAVSTLGIDGVATRKRLRQIVCDGEPALACAALKALLDLDETVIEEVAACFRPHP